MENGRARPLAAEHCLGLLQTWHRTRGSMWVLCTMFGITNTVCSLFIRFGRRLLLRVLAENEEAKVRMPKNEEMVQFKTAFSSKYPALRAVYGVADGLKLHLEQSGDCVIQNMVYKAWTHDQYVWNAFVFAPNRTIIAYTINAPGSIYDSQISDWGGVYDKLNTCFDVYQGRIVVN